MNNDESPTTLAAMFAAHGLSDPGTEAGRAYALHDVLTRRREEWVEARRRYSELLLELQAALEPVPDDLAENDPVATVRQIAAALAPDDLRALGVYARQVLRHARRDFPEVAKGHPDDEEFLDALIDLVDPQTAALVPVARRWAAAAQQGDVAGVVVQSQALIDLVCGSGPLADPFGFGGQ